MTMSMLTRTAVTIVLGATMVAALSACDPAAERQREATRKMTDQADKMIGMPNVTKFTERRLLKDLYELRDKEVATYTYTYSEYTGKLTFFCESVGYGLPFSAQFTSPTTEGGRPQPEPNGLYMPDSAESTWVMCVNPETKKVAPIYSEPRLVVSPFLIPQALGNPAKL